MKINELIEFLQKQPNKERDIVIYDGYFCKPLDPEMTWDMESDEADYNTDEVLFLKGTLVFSID